MSWESYLAEKDENILSLCGEMKKKKVFNRVRG